jgi:non-canonical poly(A) RNA polymerase PAPD5/7
MIKSFMHAEPLLRPLVLVIKVLVDSYDISDPYKGGLSSYAITLMVIALLQVNVFGL